MKVLHISHHRGCFRDQQYVLTKLGFEVLNLKFPDNAFRVTAELSNAFWNQYKHIINSVDYVLISDTSPISRCVLEHMNEFKSKLIIWICNRFDYAMQSEQTYYQLFDYYKTHTQVRIVPYTFFEKIWCLKNGIDILNCEVITPLGKFDRDMESNIPQAPVYNEWYNKPAKLHPADVFVPFYTNDNKFFPMASFLRERGIDVCNSTYIHFNELAQYKAFVTQPDAFSKILTFEAVHNNLPMILPSKQLMLQLCRTEGYLFNITGYGGGHITTSDLLDVSEWFRADLNPVRRYFDSYNDIPSIIRDIDKETMLPQFKQCSDMLEQTILSKWKLVYASF